MNALDFDWDVEGLDWPHREASRFVNRGGFSWHVQTMGSGPVALLLHGTGSSTHSFRELMPLLAAKFTVIAPDLPGHAFTSAPRSFVPSLPAMAAALEELLAGLRVKPALVVGHSAGAAIAARMALDGLLEAELLVSLCGAFLPFGGLAGAILSPAAKWLARGPFASHLVAFRARDLKSVERLVRGTGSSLDARGLELYQRLAQRPEHVAAVLAMMANWDLQPLAEDLPDLTAPMLLLAGANDTAIPPVQSREVGAMIPRGKVVIVPGAGHLLHEEQPQLTAQLILEG